MATDLAVNFVLLMLVHPFRLHHKQCVIEQENQKIGVFGIRSASALEWAFVYQLSVLVTQVKILNTRLK